MDMLTDRPAITPRFGLQGQQNTLPSPTISQYREPSPMLPQQVRQPGHPSIPNGFSHLANAERPPDPSLSYASTVPIPTQLRVVSNPLPTQKIVPRSSVSPTNSTLYIQECEAAAVASRLPPNHMSAEETSIMRQHLSHLQITSYVVIRNAILRLWIKNPMLWVSMEEAQGVAREERHFLLCREIWEFLMRRGYINFGCLDIPETAGTDRPSKEILIVGAGIAGLCAARQLQTLFAAFHDRLNHHYRVTVLEARSRIGGRVYSHDLKPTAAHPTGRVDLGAQIVTGFSGGNPLNTLLRRQLANSCHSLKQAKNNKIHGSNGEPIPAEQDLRVEGLFNLLLDVAANFRARPQISQTATMPVPGNGPSEVIKENTLETKSSPHANDGNVTTAVDQSVIDVEEVSQILSSIEALGYVLHEQKTLPGIIEAPSLGQTMSNILAAISQIADISEVDKEILGWHWANMEYACGTNLDNLSLRHWDQDDGNEFRGHHAMVIGGYSQLARGLALAPTKLNVRSACPVRLIKEHEVHLQSGETLEADKIVVAVPLGVLKSDTLQFLPELPDWKLASIQKLGYGVLNKVVLVYDEQFWSSDVDLVGSLPISHGEHTKDRSARGRFYMFWNCTNHASGRPVLTALMAGDAALACEEDSDERLIAEATLVLQRIHKAIPVPKPCEYLITRWSRDPYSRGSYSYIGPDGSGADYEALAKPIGDHWYFAGEATCRTHPSTVHGAYLSGLAVANDVLESIIGQQEISADVPLVPIKTRPQTAESSTSETNGRKRKLEFEDDHFSSDLEHLKSVQELRVSRERERLDALIIEKIGLRPEEPKRINANPFLIFQKDQWNACRLMADNLQQKKQKNTTAKATKNQIRTCLGQAWRDTSESEKQKWVDVVNQRKLEHEQSKADYQKQVTDWEKAVQAITDDFDKEERPRMVTDEEKQLIESVAAQEREEQEALDAQDREVEIDRIYS